MIYVLLSSKVNGVQFVKIGYSKDPIRRYKEIQYMCPLKLKLIITMNGNLETEAAIHRYYEEYRVKHTNEWFTVNKELKATIEYWRSKDISPKSVADFIYAGSKHRAKDKLRNLYPDLYEELIVKN